MITHTAFFGDAEYPFALTDPMIEELERLTDTGVGALYMRTVAMQFTLSDVTQIIRLGLIGGMMPPAKAAQLVEAYARNRPMSETFPLALDILDARWEGVSPKAAPVDKAAA